MNDHLGRLAERVGAVTWAAVAGALWALCHGEHGLRFAPWLALAPLFLLLGGKRPRISAWLHGTVFWLVSLYWIPATIVTFGKLPVVLAALGLLLLAAFLALLCWLPLGLLGGTLWRSGGWRRYLGLPALWVALEWMREFLFSGFPWNVAAFAVVEVPGALPLSALVGAYGVSFLLLAVNVAWAGALAERRWRPGLIATGCALALLTLGAGIGARMPAPTDVGAGRTVRLLQPNIPNLSSWDRALVFEHYERVMAQADAACEPGVLVVFPESALWPYNYDSAPALERDLGRLAARGCRVMINSISQETEDLFFNSVLLIGPTGVEGRYDKRHLVPFGEYVPFHGLLPFIDKLARMAGDFAAGRDPGLLVWGDERLGPAICYEVVYSTPVAAQVRAGATILVTMTNDAWYGDTTAPWQHLRAAQFRAAETQRPMLRAAITGVSAVIAADGAIEQLLGVNEQGVLETKISGRSHLTPYARFPWLIPALSTLLVLIACARFRPR